MKKIKIKCRVNNEINVYKFHVMIYSKNNKLILNQFTNKVGEIEFKAPYSGIYKIIIIPEKNFIPNKICTTFFVNKKCCSTLLVTFQKLSINNYHLVTFKITDKHYKGLKVEKGDLIVWQKNI